MTHSVAMCTCNGERFLAAQLDSIAAQTQPPTEVIVCDDASTDRSVEILERFASQTSFPVRIVSNPSQIGVIGNFEQAILLCQGEIISLADQDDVWRPDKLATTERALSAAPAAAAMFSNGDLIDASSHSIDRRLWDSVGFTAADRDRVLGGGAFELLVERFVVTGATLAFRADLRDLILPLPRVGDQLHDAWISLVVSAVADIIPADETLIAYRVHDHQQVGVSAGAARGGGAVTAVKTATSVHYPFFRHVDLLDRVTARLDQHRARFPSRVDEVSRSLRSHFDARDQLRDRTPLFRFGRIVGELRTRRYHRHSNGWYSAVKDLIAPTRSHPRTG